MNDLIQVYLSEWPTTDDRRETEENIKNAIKGDIQEWLQDRGINAHITMSMDVKSYKYQKREGDKWATSYPCDPWIQIGETMLWSSGVGTKKKVANKVVFNTVNSDVMLKTHSITTDPKMLVPFPAEFIAFFNEYNAKIMELRPQ